MPISSRKIIWRLGPNPIDRLDGSMAGLARWIRQIRPALRPVLLLDYHHERYPDLSCLSVFLL